MKQPPKSPAPWQQHDFRMVDITDEHGERYPGMVCHNCGQRMNSAPEHCPGPKAAAKEDAK
jgi:hypothetical protein